MNALARIKPKTKSAKQARDVAKAQQQAIAEKRYRDFRRAFRLGKDEDDLE
jgi:hypothetical protein